MRRLSSFYSSPKACPPNRSPANKTGLHAGPGALAYAECPKAGMIMTQNRALIAFAPEFVPDVLTEEGGVAGLLHSGSERRTGQLPVRRDVGLGQA